MHGYFSGGAAIERTLSVNGTAYRELHLNVRRMLRIRRRLRSRMVNEIREQK
jgi:hypothetical protein